MAGVGSRLMPKTRKVHKAMLRVGGVRIVDIQMATFSRAGFGQFSFVLGHCAATLASHLLQRYARYDICVLNNNYFDRRNLDWSAYLALTSRPGDVLYYEGDLVVAPSILRRLASHPSDVCVVADARVQSTKVDTVVLASSDRVRRIVFSEHGEIRMAAQSCRGEFLPLVKLSDSARKYVAKRLGRKSYRGRMLLYDIFNELFDNCSATVIDTDGQAWVEIDNPADLRRACKFASQLNRVNSGLTTTQPSDRSSG